MRFVIAIAAFLVAAVMIGAGIAQRTIWAPAASVTATADVHSTAPYIVIPGGTLNARDGQQTLRVAGAAAPFVAYGRTADVMAWIGDEPYSRVSYDGATRQLKSTLVRPSDANTTGSTPDATSSASPSPTPAASSPATVSATPSPTATPTATAETKAPAEVRSLDPHAPDPNGSDLWLDQFTGPKAATTTMDVPSNISVIVATDGAHAAPGSVSLTWPTDTRTPWAGPLIVLGGLLAIAGIVFYVLALRYVRRGRGPRRGGSNGRPPRLPKGPRAARNRAAEAGDAESHGRRSLSRGMIAVPVVLAGALGLAGCSSDYWPDIGAHSSPTASSTASASQLPAEKGSQAPAVTEPQLRNIVDRIAATQKTADATLNPTLAATRFTGPALTEREVNYQIRKVQPKYAAPAAIPAQRTLYPVLPQTTDTWPRAVNVVVSNTADKKAPPLDLLLTQQTARDNYKVAYSVLFAPGVQIPKQAPASIGASIVPPDSKLLLASPRQVAQSYADVLANGSNSSSYKLFDEAHDGLSKQTGAAYKAQMIQEVDSNQAAKLSFSDVPSQEAPIALATSDAGALVLTSVTESQVIAPTDPASTITVKDPNGATAALTGLTQTSKGLEADYGYQLLFYVPPAESKGTIQLLGFTGAVVGAKELP